VLTVFYYEEWLIFEQSRKEKQEQG